MLIRRKNVPANLIVALALMLGLVAGGYAVSAQDAGTPAATQEEIPGLATPATTTPLVGERFEPGAVIVTTPDSLRVRAEPTTDAEALASLPEGTPMEVISGPEEAEGFIWHEVEVLDTDEALTGWVATGADFVDPAD